MFKRVALVVWMVLVCSVGAFALDRADMESVAARMSAAAGRSFDIRVESDSDLNASASSDGHLMVTSGMLGALKTADELAFVLGHEMTHVLRKHGQRQMGNLTLGAILGLALGAYLGMEGDGLVSAAQVGAQLANGHPSRVDEYTADEQGLRLAVKAGYDPQGGVGAMELLVSRYGRGDAGIPVIGWLASHPDTENRAKKLRELATKLAQERPEVTPTVVAEPMSSWQKPTAPPSKPAPQVQTPVAPKVVTPEVPVVETTPEKPVPVIETPSGATVIDPGQKFRFGDIVSHALKGNETLSVESAPAGTVKVTFRLLGADGQIVMRGETSTVSPALVTLNTEQLSQYGKRLQLEVIALDAAGRELDRTTITIVVQQ